MPEAPPKNPPLQLGLLDKIKMKTLVLLKEEPFYQEGITEDKIFVASVETPLGDTLHECQDQSDIDDVKFFYPNGIKQWYEKKIP